MRATTPRYLSQVQYTAIAYNLIETVLAICFGWATQSSALTGFGLISGVESMADLIVLRRYKKSFGGNSVSIAMAKNQPMVPLAIFSFLCASWTLIQSLKIFMLKLVPLPTLPGLLIAECSLIFLPLLAYLSYHHFDSAKIAFKMGFNDIWAYMLLSLGLLLGLSINYFYGFWQADPVMGLIMSGFLYKKSFDNIINGGEEANDSSTTRDE